MATPVLKIYRDRFRFENAPQIGESSEMSHFIHRYCVDVIEWVLLHPCYTID
jgi:hypothetical protein